MILQCMKQECSEITSVTGYFHSPCLTDEHKSRGSQTFPINGSLKRLLTNSDSSNMFFHKKLVIMVRHVHNSFVGIMCTNDLMYKYYVNKNIRQIQFGTLYARDPLAIGRVFSNKSIYSIGLQLGAQFGNPWTCPPPGYTPTVSGR